MPGFNGTGPMGAGSMTGRGMGYCRPGYNAPAAEYNYGRGAGFRRGGRGFYGSGQGMGFGRRQVSPWNQPVYEQNNITSRENSLNSLKNEADYLKNALDEINSRISEVEKTGWWKESSCMQKIKTPFLIDRGFYKKQAACG